MIEKIKNGKCSGPDNIPNEVFTKANQETKTIYLKILNIILEKPTNAETMAKRYNNQTI